MYVQVRLTLTFGTVLVWGGVVVPPVSLAWRARPVRLQLYRCIACSIAQKTIDRL